MESRGGGGWWLVFSLAIGRAVTLAEIVPWFSVFDHGF